MVLYESEVRRKAWKDDDGLAVYQRYLVLLTENADDKQGAMFCKRWAEVPYNGTVEWYYFDENGTMKTDWLTQDENKFYLYPIADGTRGRMLTGWQKIGDNWYYFHEESDGNKGVLARRTKIGNYYVNSDGVWAK